MLFSYIYVPHQMEKMQEFIDFIFYEVWCRAPIGLVFDADLFDNNPDLKTVMSEFGYSAGAAERGKAFFGDVKAIYALFATLSVQEIDQFKQWYQGNNNIEKVCVSDSATALLRYTDIPAKHQKLSEHLASFFKGLYSQSLLGLAALKDQIGDIEEHYKIFMQKNKTGKCPFCGINDLLGEYQSRRDAYDHYLPKALYPFNSINFHNLVPACHHCNSSYKTSKDPAYIPKDPAGVTRRRAVFYPYTTEPNSITLQVILQHSDIEKLTPDDINLRFGPSALDEKIETWKDVYGIEERYKAKFCSNDALNWLELVRTASDCGTAPTLYLANLRKQTQKYPMASCNFLMQPFLDACDKLGIFKIM